MAKDIQIMQSYQSHCEDLAVNLHEIGINYCETGTHWTALRKKVIYF